MSRIISKIADADDIAWLKFIAVCLIIMWVFGL